MNDGRLIQSFGRRRDRGLSALQKKSLDELYKLYGIDCPENKIDPHIFFENNFRELVVEIGFGHGEHLVEAADKNRDCGFIGCEPFEITFAISSKVYLPSEI